MAGRGAKKHTDSETQSDSEVEKGRLSLKKRIAEYMGDDIPAMTKKQEKMEGRTPKKKPEEKKARENDGSDDADSDDLFSEEQGQPSNLQKIVQLAKELAEKKKKRGSKREPPERKFPTSKKAGFRRTKMEEESKETADSGEEGEREQIIVSTSTDRDTEEEKEKEEQELNELMRLQAEKEAREQEKKALRAAYDEEGYAQGDDTDDDNDFDIDKEDSDSETSGEEDKPPPPGRKKGKTTRQKKPPQTRGRQRQKETAREAQTGSASEEEDNVPVVVAAKKTPQRKVDRRTESQNKAQREEMRRKLEKATKEHQKELEDLPACPYCDKKFKRKRWLIHHMQSYHPTFVQEGLPDQVLDAAEVKDPKKSCPHCGKVVAKLARHMRDNCKAAKVAKRSESAESRKAERSKSVPATTRTRGRRSARRDDNNNDQEEAASYPVGGTRGNPKGETRFWKVMENYFRVQNYAEKTKEQYIPAIRKLMEFFGELRDFEEDDLTDLWAGENLRLLPSIDLYLAAHKDSTTLHMLGHIVNGYSAVVRALLDHIINYPEALTEPGRRIARHHYEAHYSALRNANKARVKSVANEIKQKGAETRFEQEEMNEENIYTLFQYIAEYYKNPLREKFLNDMMKEGAMKARCADEHGYVLVRNRLMAELLLNGGANRAETIINITRGQWINGKNKRVETSEGKTEIFKVIYIKKHKTAKRGGALITVNDADVVTVINIFALEVRVQEDGVSPPFGEDNDKAPLFLNYNGRGMIRHDPATREIRRLANMPKDFKFTAHHIRNLFATWGHDTGQATIS